MHFLINDLHTDLLARALLEPGEQLTGKVMGKSEPWYTRFLRFDIFMPYTLFLATDRRLIMLEHKRRFLAAGYELASVESVPWAEVEELAAKGLITKNRIRVRVRSKRATLKVPMMFAPLRNNGRELKSVVGIFEARRSMAPGALAGTGPATPYMQPGYAAPQLPSMHPAQPGYGVQQQQQASGYPQAPQQSGYPGAYVPPYNNTGS